VREQNNRTESVRDPDGALADVVTADVVEGAVGEPGAVGVLVGAHRTRLVLTGEVDIELERELRDAIRDAEKTGQPIEIDAHHVTFIDSTGVSFIAELATRATPRVRVLRAPPSMKFLLTVTRLDELVELVDVDPGFE
jgi:anti-anti-sigma factor